MEQLPAVAEGPAVAERPVPPPISVRHDTPETGVTAEPAEADPTSPPTPHREVAEQIRGLLRRHPSFLNKVLPPALRSPSSAEIALLPTRRVPNRWRTPIRHTFYLSVFVALMVLTCHVVSLKRAAKEHERAAHVLEEITQPPKPRTPGQIIRSALTAQATLIVINVVLAVRGVQIWGVISRAGESPPRAASARAPPPDTRLRAAQASCRSPRGSQRACRSAPFSCAPPRASRGRPPHTRRPQVTRRIVHLVQITTLPVRQTVQLPFRPVGAIRRAAAQRAAAEAAARAPKGVAAKALSYARSGAHIVYERAGGGALRIGSPIGRASRAAAAAAAAA